MIGRYASPFTGSATSAAFVSCRVGDDCAERGLAWGRTVVGIACNPVAAAWLAGAAEDAATLKRPTLEPLFCSSVVTVRSRTEHKFICPYYWGASVCMQAFWGSNSFVLIQI